MKAPSDIAVDPAIQGGRPVVRGTRVTVDVLIRALAAGESLPAVAGNYRLSEAQVRAALEYVADLISAERTIALSA